MCYNSYPLNFLWIDFFSMLQPKLLFVTLLCVYLWTKFISAIKRNICQTGLQYDLLSVSNLFFPCDGLDEFLLVNSMIITRPWSGTETGSLCYGKSFLRMFAFFGLVVFYHVLKFFGLLFKLEMDSTFPILMICGLSLPRIIAFL